MKRFVVAVVFVMAAVLFAANIQAGDTALRSTVAVDGVHSTSHSILPATFTVRNPVLGPRVVRPRLLFVPRRSLVPQRNFRVVRDRSGRPVLVPNTGFRFGLGIGY